ncbi:CoA-transferase [Piscinibacter sakaiensis]|uniref:3-oxoadipate CoA-transferase, subunit A n=1 Tax=Piscinibacter sakaiensis TaxID=1547922 RepID=A0A0K8P5Q2_PISS1|nr:CoA-transferase [Piscinibacter sakaiensis]GAP37917.1 3-oxoadipate CoA-transferase, subunit A [Piscinibacter sakaiensis]
MSKSKLVTLDEAVADIADGAKVGLGGWIFNAQPMALVRALIRRGARDLDLVPMPGSIAPDMLIGAGCVRSTICVFISFEQFGLAPHFRRQAEAGTLKVHELDGPALAGGMRAAICDLPYMPIPNLGTDHPRYAPEFYRPLPTGPGERKLLAAAAVRPDVCLLHAQQADEHGNVQYLGAPFFDAMLAQASRKVIVSVDRIVSSETIRRSNHLTKLPSAMVDRVVEAPWGAHPTASPSLYRGDDKHLKEYVKASAGDAAFAAYLEKYVREAGTQQAYLDALGGARVGGLSASESNLS